MVNKRISNLSCHEITLNTIVTYELALNQGGYKNKMKFDQQPYTKKNRNRKIIWLNPSFSQNVKTNVEKIFFKLLRKSFSKNHEFRKIFNLNTLKLSYSSMANLQSLIKQDTAKGLIDGKKPK